VRGVYQRGSAWYVTAVVNGKRVRKRAGSKSEAMRLRQTLAPDPIVGPSIDEVFRSYLRHLEATAKPESVKCTRNRLRRTMLYFSGSAAGINGETLADFIAARRRQVKPASVNCELIAIRSALHHAVTVGLLERVPVRIRLLRLERRPPTVLTREEFQRLLSFAPHYLRPLLELAWLTALRSGELCTLRWGSVDLQRGVLRVEAEQSKNYSYRDVPLNTRARELLCSIRNGRTDNQLVFASPRGGRWNIEGLAHAVAVVCRKAGLHQPYHTGMHCLRRSSASELLSKGASVNAVRLILGHSNLQTVLRYVHSQDSELRQAVEAL